MIELENYAEKAIEFTSTMGASYTDIRTEKRKYELYVVENGILKMNLFSHDKSGIGIRVIYNGAWGFFSTTDLSVNGIKKAAEQAIKLAKMSAERIKNKVILAPINIYEDHVKTKVKQNFWDISPEEKIEWCFQVEERLRSDPKITTSSVQLAGIGGDKFFNSSEGTRIKVENTIVYSALRARAKGASEHKYVGGTGGFEVIRELDVHSEAENICKSIVGSLKAKTSSDLGNTNVVMDQDYLSIVVHETIAHPSEADRIVGMEKAWAGSAWWVGWLGKKIGSENLSVVDDPTIEGSLPFYLYDDEGVKARKKLLIEKGVLKEHMHSRQTAAMLNSEPNAGMRAVSYEFFPLIRMSNTYIEPGDWTLEEIIEDTKEGIYLSGRGTPSIDEKRVNWSISAQKAYLIEKGEIKDMVKGIKVVGISHDFFNSIDAVAKDLNIIPLPLCGKGDPPQTGINVGNGGPHIRCKAMVYSIGGGL